MQLDYLLIPQVVSLTQPEPQHVASKWEIPCVFPLRAGGAVSVTVLKIKKENENRAPDVWFFLKKKTHLFSSLGVNYFSSVLPFLSAVQQGFMGAEVQVLFRHTAV